MSQAPVTSRRAPSRAPGVRVAPADDDGTTVLYDEPGARLHVLDPLAALVFACLDGESTVDEIAADIAEEFGADEQESRATVDSVVSLLFDRGLVIEGADPDR